MTPDYGAESDALAWVLVTDGDGQRFDDRTLRNDRSAPDVTATDVRNAIEVLRAAGYLVIDPDGKVMARWEEPAEDPPMPAAVAVHGTVRGVRDHGSLIGSREQVVARIFLQDWTGDARSIDLSPEVALDLLVKLGQFVRQTGVEGL